MLDFLLEEVGDYEELTTYWLRAQFHHVNVQATLTMISYVIDFNRMTFPLWILSLFTLYFSLYMACSDSQ